MTTWLRALLVAPLFLVLSGCYYVPYNSAPLVGPSVGPNNVLVVSITLDGDDFFDDFDDDGFFPFFGD